MANLRAQTPGELISATFQIKLSLDGAHPQ
jgi:hypothetical protein